MIVLMGICWVVCFVLCLMEDKARPKIDITPPERGDIKRKCYYHGCKGKVPDTENYCDRHWDKHHGLD